MNVASGIKFPQWAVPSPVRDVAIATLASLRDEQLRRQLHPGEGAVQFRLYALLRSEQRLAVSAATDGRLAEVPAILTQAQSAFLAARSSSVPVSGEG
jgi:hypothetical protein